MLFGRLDLPEPPGCAWLNSRRTNQMLHQPDVAPITDSHSRGVSALYPGAMAADAPALHCYERKLPVVIGRFPARAGILATERCRKTGRFSFYVDSAFLQVLFYGCGFLS